MFSTLRKLREKTEAARTALAAAPNASSRPEDNELLAASGTNPQQHYEPWDGSAPTIIPYKTHEEVIVDGKPRDMAWEKVADDKFTYQFAMLDLTPEKLSHHIWENCKKADEAIAKIQEEEETPENERIPLHSEMLRKAFELGFFIAGGSICTMLQGIPEISEGGDYDFFAVGMKPEEAEAKFFELAKLYQTPRGNRSLRLYQGENCSTRTIVDRTLNCITILDGFEDDGNKTEIQLITRLYASIAEVLLSFDIAPCAVGWDGKRVYMTPEAEFAHQTGVFWPDISKRRRSFEDRIGKYFRKKGFGVVLPHLDCQHPSFKEIVAKGDNVELAHLKGVLNPAGKNMWWSCGLYTTLCDPWNCAGCTGLCRTSIGRTSPITTSGAFFSTTTTLSGLTMARATLGWLRSPTMRMRSSGTWCAA